MSLYKLMKIWLALNDFHYVMIMYIIAEQILIEELFQNILNLHVLVIFKVISLYCLHTLRSII
jgi:hypothetical protein